MSARDVYNLRPLSWRGTANNLRMSRSLAYLAVTKRLGLRDE